MARGPGEYDSETTQVHQETQADAVILVVLGGNRGSGFSVTAVKDVDVAKMLPAILRDVASQIEKDV